MEANRTRDRIREGFAIERPEVFVPWSVTQEALQALLRPSLRTVRRGYYVIRGCTSLGGLKHELGFHFQDLVTDRLQELEFFSFAFPELEVAYSIFQQHLELTFGPPTETTEGTLGFPTHEWRNYPGVEIRHLVFDRFGPEEHVRIRQ